MSNCTSMSNHIRTRISKIRVARIAFLGAILMLANCSERPAQETVVVGEWPAYGATIGNTKYTALDQIDASNVNQLEIAWRRAALDPYYLTLNPQQNFSSTYTSAPIVKNGIAYIPNGVGLVEAFNPGTGATL